MHCQVVDQDELLEKYLNGQLDPNVQDDLEVHILECPRCQQAVDVLQAVRDDLVQHAHEVRSQSSQHRVRLRWQWVAVASAFVIVCGAGVTYLHRSGFFDLQGDASIATGPPQSSTGSNPATSPEPPKSSSDENVLASHPTSSPLEPGGAAAKPRASGHADIAPPVPAPNADANPPQTANLAPPLAPGGEVLPSLKVESPPVSAAIPPAANADAAAVEIYRLGMVQPPPYTFPGVASSAGSTARPDAKAVVPRGGSRASFESGMLAYVERRYGDAASLLENAAQVEPAALDVKFFLGVSRLLLGKPADSLASLQAVATSERSRYRQAAHFYLAKAYLQIGNLDQAEAELNAAAALPGQLRAEASSELQRLRAVRSAMRETQNP